MLSMAVRTDRSVRFATLHQLPGDTFEEITFDSFVAFAAGAGDIEMIYRRFAIAGRIYPVGASSCRVAVVAGRRNINATLRCLPVNAVFVDLDRMVDQDIVLARDIEIFMASSTRLGEVHRVGSSDLHAGRQNIVISVAVCTMGHIFTVPDCSSSVCLIFLRCLGMARTTPLTSDLEIRILAVRHRVFIDVASQAVEALVR